jgi:hypothetical protein
VNDDIVTRLRRDCMSLIADEAADEIERLRAERDRMRQERDEARTMHMMLLSDLGPDGLKRYQNLIRNSRRPNMDFVNLVWSVINMEL